MKHIHHKDGDPTNNALSNIEIVDGAPKTLQASKRSEYERGYHDGHYAKSYAPSSTTYIDGYEAGKLTRVRFGAPAEPEQGLLWMPPADLDKPPMSTRILPHMREPKRLWTLIRESQGATPVLPYVPVHNQNAFLEDKIHDWNFANGKLRYYSRVVNAHEGVWLLLEY